MSNFARLSKISYFTGLMKISVETLSHPPLVFSSSLPAGVMRLGGAVVLSATGSFGSLCIQEFDTPGFLIRYTVIITQEPFTIHTKSFYNGLHAVVLQQGGLEAQIKDAGSFQLQEGQFTLIHAPEPEATLSLNARQQYTFFEILLPDVFILDLASEFAHLNLPFSRQVPEIWVNPARYIDEEVKDHIRYILHYTDNPAWRRNYYENRVWDIGWKLLALHTGDGLPTASVNEEELFIAHRVQKLITDNLDMHLRIRELAKKAGTSESKLKQIFTKVYGMAIHEYRIQQRLKKAITLIHEGKLIKEAAAMTGWRSANLIKAYNKIYRTTPGTIKKKK
jgi:AraC-like DNA-binding protein